MQRDGISLAPGAKLAQWQPRQHVLDGTGWVAGVVVGQGEAAMAGVDNVWEQEKLEAREMLEIGAESPPAKCALCWAGFDGKEHRDNLSACP